MNNFNGAIDTTVVASFIYYYVRGASVLLAKESLLVSFFNFNSHVNEGMYECGVG